MNYRQISSGNLASMLEMKRVAPFSMTRRQFARKAAAATIIGTTVGAGCWKPAIALPTGSSDPVPIPSGTPGLGGAYHIFGPTPDGSGDPIDAEPATITDFNGFVGLTYVDVNVTQTNNSTGEVLQLPSFFSDMRFMLGEYRGQDGKLHHGAFALV